MKQLLLMLALCFQMCLIHMDNSAGILPKENSPCRRTPLKSVFSFYQGANKATVTGRKIKGTASGASKNQQVSTIETNSIPGHRGSRLQLVASSSLVNFLSLVNSMVYDLLNVLLGRKNNQGKVITGHGQQRRLKAYKHEYIIPPPQPQNDKFFYRGNTRAYVSRKASRQTGQLLKPVDTNGSSNQNIGNIFRNIYSVIMNGTTLLTDEYKSKIFKIFRSIFSGKASNSKTRRRTSYEPSTSPKFAKKNFRRKAIL